MSDNPSVQSAAQFQLIWLPDGLRYTLVSHNVQSYIAPYPVRVITPSADARIQDTLAQHGFVRHQTQFYEISASNRTQLLTSNSPLQWKYLQSEYTYVQVRPDDAMQVESLRQCMQASFAMMGQKSAQEVATKTSAIQVFHTAFIDGTCADARTIICLVRRRTDTMLVGSFTLVYVPFLQEIQLHSVAGISPEQTQKIQRKLAIILAAACDYVEQSKQYHHLPIRFSCSKPPVQHKYQELGIHRNTSYMMWHQP